MCGIVGYIGKKQALPILLEGIRSLEYRGYDSAGLTILNERGRYTAKAVGRVLNLENKVKDINLAGTLGIIQTRWATHGAPTEANAHPHSDCTGDIQLVHNGIIENYKELKEKLLAAGHKFKSETDTEVLAHLIEESRSPDVKSGSRPGRRDSQLKAKSLEDAVRIALRQIRGTYGIAVVDAREPDALIAARNFSPLLLGIGKDEYFVASDAAAVVGHTKNVIYLNDGEMAVLGRNSFRVCEIAEGGLQVQKEMHEIEWSPEAVQKGGYEHFMLKEIFEQPEAIENSIRGRLVAHEGAAKLGGLLEVQDELAKIKKLHIVACGTSYFAGRVGEYMLEEYAGIPVEVDLASEFRYRNPVFKEGDAVLVTSQSGETADTLAALRLAKQNGALVLGVVNTVGSTIARETDAGVYQHIGPEIGVASTKAFTSQVSILALITLLLGRDPIRQAEGKQGMSKEKGIALAEGLKEIPNVVREALKQSDSIRAIAEKYARMPNFLYLGRKYNLPTAFEGALKIKEVAYVHAEGYGAGEMKHGPIAMIDHNFPSVCIALQDSVYEKNISNIEEIKARKGPVIAIATEGDKEIAKLADDVIYIPKVLEALSPIVAVVPLQLFAYHFAVLKGLDVDKPRNLAKSVTVE